MNKFGGATKNRSSVVCVNLYQRLNLSSLFDVYIYIIQIKRRYLKGAFNGSITVLPLVKILGFIIF